MSTTAISQRSGQGRRAVPGRRALVLASLMVLFGAFLPWVTTPIGSFSGMTGAGVWTFYAGSLGLAGALIRRPLASAVQAGILAAAAIALPAWQVLHLLGLGGWTPGLGLVLTFFGGLLAAQAARTYARTR